MFAGAVYIKPGKLYTINKSLPPENINNPEIALSWDNLELLCRDCHAKTHGNKKRYHVDEFGRVKLI